MNVPPLDSFVAGLRRLTKRLLTTLTEEVAERLQDSKITLHIHIVDKREKIFFESMLPEKFSAYLLLRSRNLNLKPRNTFFFFFFTQKRFN